MNVYKIDYKQHINDCKFIHIFASFVNADLPIKKGTQLFLFSETKELSLRTEDLLLITKINIYHEKAVSKLHSFSVFVLFILPPCGKQSGRISKNHCGPIQ